MPTILWNCSKILIRLWEGCLTGCTGCNEPFKKKKYFPVDEITSAIRKSSEVFSPEVRFFLFGQDPIWYPELDHIISIIRSVNGNEICIHLSDINNYNDLSFQKLQSILESYSDIGLYISTSSQVLWNWSQKNIIIFCQKMQRYFENIFIQIYYDEVQDIKIQNIALFHYFFPHNTISFTRNIAINHQNKTVSNNEKSCKFFNTIQLDWNIVTFSPLRLDDFEFEVTYTGDIIPHTPRCYMAKIFISNIYLEAKTIHSHFLHFLDFINTINTASYSFDQNCYNCIFWKHSFTYKEIWK